MGGIRSLSEYAGSDLSLFFCETLKEELTRVFQVLTLPENVELQFYPHYCTAGTRSIRRVQAFFRERIQPGRRGLLFGDASLKKPGILPREISHAGPGSCHALVAPDLLISDHVSKGAYILFPGWLVSWERYVTEMGFDPKKPTTFFSSGLTRIVMLDTGVSVIAEERIRSFEIFAGLPVISIPVGISYLSAIVEAEISKWRSRVIQSSCERKVQSLRESYSTQIAVLSLISDIATVSEEQEVISRIFIMIQSLFAPEQIEFLPVFSTGPGKMICFPPGSKPHDPETLLSRIEDGYHLLQDNGGFVVSVHHKENILGVLAVYDVSVPDRIREYLNLTLSFVSFLALVIMNSRSWSEIQSIKRELEEANLKLSDSNEGLLAISKELQRSNQELTESKSALLKNDQFIKTIVNSANIGIVVVDKNFHVLFWNSEMERIFGLNSEPVLGKNIIETFPHITEHDRLPYLLRALSGEKVSAPDIEILSDIRGESTWISSLFIPIYDQDHEIIGITDYVYDITFRKMYEQDMERAYEAIHSAQKKLAILNSITRHDILNRVTVINGYSELMAESVADMKLKKQAENIHTAGEDIRHLIAFTKEYQEIGFKKPVWLRIDDVLNRRSIQSVLTGFELSLQEIAVEIFVDPMLEKVMYNLIENSRRHGEHVSKVTISALQSGDDYVISYADNGVGILDEEKNLIFEQGHGKNTGMGLFLIREILDLTGISIRECGMPGEGAVFEIKVPKGGWRKISPE